MVEQRQPSAISGQPSARTYWSGVTAVAVQTADRSALASPRWKPLGLAVFGLALILGFGGSLVWAAEEEKLDEKVIQKAVTGQVVWVGKRAISVEYEKTASESLEMLLPYDPKTLKLERLKDVAELKRGDTVSVRYQQTYQKGEDDSEKLIGTVATTVALLKQAPPEGTLQSTSGTSVE